MGLLIAGLNFVTNVWVAVPFLILLGAVSGYLVVPMNALLQHRGHNLMGAGPLDRGAELQRAGLHPGPERAVRVDDQVRRHALRRRSPCSAWAWPAIMWFIRRWHQRNCVLHFDEVERLLAIARSDKH